MQCPRGTSYSPCASKCPVETCDNSAIFKRLSLACEDDVCTEGCSPDPCRPDSVKEVELCF